MLNLICKGKDEREANLNKLCPTPTHTIHLMMIGAFHLRFRPGLPNLFPNYIIVFFLLFFLTYCFMKNLTETQALKS